MAEVTLEHVTKTFGGKRSEVRAVDDLNLAVANQEFAVLVGPSGCGKTTTLRLIAGLEELTAGTIRIGERVVNDVAPRDRDIAMVFQNYALYPHMTVFKNMAFGLKMRRVPRDEIRRKVGEVAVLLGLTHLLDRKPGALSGGECQRVALGRAIVRRPQVFLFDEPLSNLDAGLRIQMRTEIKSLHGDMQATIIHVTHDQEEAMTLGDRIMIMKEGVIRQCGTPLAVYNRPANRFVAGFIGKPPMNFLQGRLDGDGEAVFFAGGLGHVEIPPQVAGSLKAHRGRNVVLGIRPENVALEAPDGVLAEGCPTFSKVWAQSVNGNRAAAHDTKCEGPEHPFRAAGQMSVRVVEPLGDSTNVHLVVSSGESLVARVPPAVTISPGQKVRLLLDMSRAHVFAADEQGQRLN